MILLPSFQSRLFCRELKIVLAKFGRRLVPVSFKPPSTQRRTTMKVPTWKIAALLVAGCAWTAAWAHTPLCSCYDNGDGSVECEGGFSDGSSAAGVAMKVMDASGKVIQQGKMDKSSTFSFKKPAGNYSVLFDAGEGHRITIPSSKISK